MDESLGWIVNVIQKNNLKSNYPLEINILIDISERRCLYCMFNLNYFEFVVKMMACFNILEIKEN